MILILRFFVGWPPDQITVIGNVLSVETTTFANYWSQVIHIFQAARLT